MRPRAFVFDAYGTLFDVASAARDAGLGPVWPRLAEDWRRKQLEYTWLRTIMGAHADFATVTADALDWALEAHGLGTDHALRTRMLALYDRLAPFPEVRQTLSDLHRKGARLAILSNGTPSMLASAVTAAGLADVFDAVLSVEDVGLYKPAPAVYALATAALNLPAAQVMFVSSNGWDIAGAARFGFVTAWVNRMAAPIDRLPHVPALILPDLTPLRDYA